MSKYQPLQEFLENKKESQVPMTFSQIESVIHEKLPPSARKHRAWWSNNPSNSVITYAWLAAGFRSSEVNLEGEKVVFCREDARNYQTGWPDSTPDGSPAIHPVFGCLSGTVTSPEGTDLTDPAMPEWSDATRRTGGIHE